MSRVQELFQDLLANAEVKKELWPKEYMTILDTPDIEKEPLIVRKGLAFKKYLSEMPIKVHERELLVGETSMGTIGMGVAFIDYATEEEKAKAAEKGLGIKSVWGHNTPMYEKLLEVGVRGMKEIVRTKLSALKDPTGEDRRKANFYRAVLCCYEGMETLVERYSVLTATIASTEKDTQRKEELIEISRICRKIATEKPETFREAMQLLWFTHMILHSTMDYVPVGRFDYYMYPFYKNDLDAGYITPEDAQELIDCLWIKANDRAQLKSGLVENNFDSAFMQLGGAFDIELDNEMLTMAWQQNVILGGKHPDGSDATNDLTYMALEATAKFNLANPVVTVRIGRSSPERLYKKVAECLQGGGGYPFIHNDDVIIEGLEKLGVPREEANMYANDGCWECTIPGKTEFRYSYLETLVCLELVLNRGRRSITGELEGPDTGDPSEFSSFEEFYAAFEKQISARADSFIENILTYYGSVYDIAPDPFMSSLVDDCIEKGKDLTEGGARYIFHAPLVAALANTANSLAVIKKLVYEDKTLSMSDLVEILSSNYEGKENFRQLVLNRVPKFGNDNDYVDDLARKIVDSYSSIVNEKAKITTGSGFPAARVLLNDMCCWEKR